MFRPCTYRPFLRYLEGDEGGGGAGTGTDLGFPANTPVEEMDDKQQAAYWRNQSKVQQAARKSAEATVAASAADKDAAEKWRAHETASQTEHEKELEAAREEARRDGENLGAQRYLRDAVVSTFQSLTGKTDEEIETAFAVVDISKFVDEKGDIDRQKLKDFAATFGPSGAGGQQQQAPHDPVRAALERQRSGGTSGQGDGSVAAIREARREQLLGTGNSK